MEPVVFSFYQHILIMQRIFYALTLFSVFFAIGCGNAVVIKGTAKMADGTTVTNGTVLFVSDSAQYSANIQTNGTFSPGVDKDGEGIPPGVYQISVVGVSREETRPGESYPIQISLIASKYGDHRTSGISLDTSKEKTLNLELEPAAE